MKYRIVKQGHPRSWQWWVYLGDDAVRAFPLKKYAINWILEQEKK
jgi:hypothetical protein